MGQSPPHYWQTHPQSLVVEVGLDEGEEQKEGLRRGSVQSLELSDWLECPPVGWDSVFLATALACLPSVVQCLAEQEKRQQTVQQHLIPRYKGLVLVTLVDTRGNTLFFFCYRCFVNGAPEKISLFKTDIYLQLIYTYLNSHLTLGSFAIIWTGQRQEIMDKEEERHSVGNES